MRSGSIGVVLAFCIVQGAVAFEDELRLVAGLTEAGFPKLATMVLSRTLKQFPDAENASQPLRIRILIAEKNFAQAHAGISSLAAEEQPALWRFLADSAYGAGDHAAAESAYKIRLALPGDPDETAVVQYGDLLERRGDTATAQEIYRDALTRIESRAIQARLAALLLESDPVTALQLAEEVQLGGLDLWFGQAVVLWAQLLIDRGEWDNVTAVLETQLQLLHTLEASLREQAFPVSTRSPLAGARYWLGACYEHQGKQSAALTQFYNVYAQYGDSPWGPLAQEKAQALIAAFEAQGKTVEIDCGSLRDPIGGRAFHPARRLFFDRAYAEATAAYIAALNQYPEGEQSLNALRELAQSYIYLNDLRAAHAVSFYLAERFSDQDAAGDALLAAGKLALDQEKQALAWNLYDHYIESFPAHSKAPAVLYTLAELRDDERFLNLIIERNPESAYGTRAVGRLAWNAYEAENYALAAERFQPYIELESDEEKRLRAQFAQAQSFRNLATSSAATNDWSQALDGYCAVDKSIQQLAERYGISAEQLAANQSIWEKSLYYQLLSHKALGQVEQAIAVCDRFSEQFNESELFPRVQFARAETLLDDQQFEAALSALEPLLQFPDAVFAERVPYYCAQSLAALGRYREAIDCLSSWWDAWPNSAYFFEAKFVEAGALYALEEYERAQEVYGEIMRTTSDDLLLHRASLELGRAQRDPLEKLASFQRVALLADPAQAGHAPLMVQALFESLPLYRELGRFDELVADARRLQSEFPSHERADELERWIAEAQQAEEENL